MRPTALLVRAVLPNLFVGNFEILWSPISGPIVEASLGMLSQTVRLAFDFFQSESFLFIGDHCPVFVKCFEPQSSPTHSLESPELTDFANIGSLGNRMHRFRLAEPPETPVLRDVGGIIGIGPKSKFFFEHVLNITVGNGRLNVAVFQPAFLQDNDPTVHWLRSESETVWAFSAKFAINDLELVGDHAFSVVIDPHNEGLVLPQRLWPEIILKLTTENVMVVTGEMMKVPCDLGASNPKFKFGFKHDQRLTIPLTNLVDSTEPEREIALDSAGKEIELCRLNVKFWESDFAAIGKVLFTSVEYLALNFPKRSLAFKPGHMGKGADAIRVLIPEIPLFTDPVIARDGSLVLRRSPDGNLMLRSPNPQHVDLRSCWTFYAIADSKTQTTETVYHGKNIGIMVSENEIRFPLTQSDSNSLVVSKSSSTVRVCVDRDLNGFDLPPARTADESSEVVDCPICCDLMVQGDSVQDMRHCGHTFHEKCIRQWIMRKPECPVCRTTIRTTPRPTTGWNGYGGVLSCIMS